MYIDETEEWEKEDAELEEYALKTGGGGSNMAEPLYFKPGPVRIPAGLPPEEVVRRIKELEDIDEILDRAIAHSEAAKHCPPNTDH